MMGGKKLLKKIQLHTDILRIMLGRATLHNYHNMYRSNPHLEDVFQEFQMIILSSWAYLQDLVNGKHFCSPPPLMVSHPFYCHIAKAE